MDMKRWNPLMRDEKLRKAVGARIKALRKQKKWTQKELAAKLEMDFLHLNKYEGGQHMPPLEKLAKIAEALDTTLDYLVFGKLAPNNLLRNRQLLERFQILEELEWEDQETVIKLVDAVIAKSKLKALAKEVA